MIMVDPMLFIEGNPYQTPASRELDAYIHCQILNYATAGECPKYSTDQADADRLKKRIENEFKIKIVCGMTSMRGKPWFARYEIAEGNPTEALADTYALAICRLVLLRAKRA
jgi:hypothetical protein